MNIEVIGNINMNSLKFYMKDYNFIENCAFGNYILDLFDENSSLYTSKSEMIILFIDIDELTISFDELVTAIEYFIVKTKKTLIINSVIFKPEYIDSFLNDTLEKELSYNQKLLEISKIYSNLFLFDLNKISKYNDIIDEKYWYMARIKYNKKGFELISNELNNLIQTYKFGSKKVLVLDMDNTLWGGVIGEEEIQLSNDGIGKIYLDFQKNIKKLKELGILLAICSKNNYEDGIAGLHHINSYLREDDFLIKKINWNDKASNIQQIAQELNLGESSIVFIDDNPVERSLVQEFLPEVNTPDFPKDIYTLNSWFLKVVNKYFAKINLTQEDLEKQKQYEAKFKRDLLSSNNSYEDFLKNLNIEIDFFINDEEYIQRYSQMTQKTNQFNLTTKRYTVADITKFIKDNTFTVIAVNYRDKFGNEGITGLVILDNKDNYISIDTFLLSCRILKRGVEAKLFQKIEELSKGKNILAEYIPTSKNIQTKDLYSDFGYEKLEENKYIKRGKS